MKLLAQLVQFFLTWASYLVPRNKKLILYADNNLNSTIYLFRYASQLDDGCRHVYLTPYPEVAKRLRDEGCEVAMRWSVSSVYLAFRAKTYVVSSSKGQINNPLSRHALVVNLWHGISVKKIGLMTYRSEKRKLQKAEEFGAFRFLSATSRLTQQCFMEAFGKPASEVPILGEPRNDFLVKNKEQRNTVFLGNYLEDDFSRYNKIIGYLPTWRDYGEWDTGIDYQTLNERLASHSSLLIIKPHPKDKTFNFLENMSHIKVVKRAYGWQDAYEVLVGLDILVTDYSSLAYEFILMERPVILYTPDYQQFAEDRELWIDYQEIAPAKQVSGFSEFLEELEADILGRPLPEVYRDVLDRLHEIKDGSSCHKVHASIISLIESES